MGALGSGAMTILMGNLWAELEGLGGDRLRYRHGDGCSYWDRRRGAGAAVGAVVLIHKHHVSVIASLNFAWFFSLLIESL